MTRVFRRFAFTVFKVTFFFLKLKRILTQIDISLCEMVTSSSDS